MSATLIPKEINGLEVSTTAQGYTHADTTMLKGELHCIQGLHWGGARRFSSGAKLFHFGRNRVWAILPRFRSRQNRCKTLTGRFHTDSGPVWSLLFRPCFDPSQTLDSVGSAPMASPNWIQTLAATAKATSAEIERKRQEALARLQASQARTPRAPPAAAAAARPPPLPRPVFTPASRSFGVAPSGAPSTDQRLARIEAAARAYGEADLDLPEPNIGLRAHLRTTEPAKPFKPPRPFKKGDTDAMRKPVLAQKKKYPGDDDITSARALLNHETDVAQHDEDDAEGDDMIDDPNRSGLIKHTHKTVPRREAAPAAAPQPAVAVPVPVSVSVPVPVPVQAPAPALLPVQDPPIASSSLPVAPSVPVAAFPVVAPPSLPDSENIPATPPQNPTPTPTQTAAPAASETGKNKRSTHPAALKSAAWRARKKQAVAAATVPTPAMPAPPIPSSHAQEVFVHQLLLAMRDHRVVALMQQINNE